MAAPGWIRLHRKVLDNPMWPNGRAYTKLEAFLDILLRVNYEPGKIKFGGGTFEVKRGELITSEVKLAERWQWSRMKVRRFLDELKMEQICHKNGTSKYTALTLINYEFLQGDDTANDTGVDTARDTSDDTQYKKLRNKENAITPYGVIVDLFHAHCPSISVIKTVTTARKNRMRLVYKEVKDIDYFKKLFKKVESSDFLTGRKPSKSNPNWRADFDWIFKSDNHVKIMEGKYDNHENNGGVETGIIDFLGRGADDKGNYS